MKTFIYTLLTILTVGLVASAQAGDTCGGFIEFSKDCGSSQKNYSVSCCPSGGTVTGVAYSDFKGDEADAVSAMCANSAGQNVVVGSD